MARPSKRSTIPVIGGQDHLKGKMFELVPWVRRPLRRWWRCKRMRPASATGVELKEGDVESYFS